MYRSFKKVFRFYSIYGFRRTITKVAGRYRSFSLFRPIYLNSQPSIGLIGCGQFQFATIAYFLSKGKRNRFSYCFDLNEENARSMASYYGIKNVLTEMEELESHEMVKCVYIASNHSTHSLYSVQLLKKGIDVYCEKPISVTFDQFDELLGAIRNSNSKFFAGYNRPYSQAIRTIKNNVMEKKNTASRFSLNCFISAHDIPENHWYRNPEEGTRICGNVGHWLDLMIHMYNWRGYIPKEYKVQIAYSNVDEPDDNITIAITTPEGDITSITISARSEPFEGINETINFQYDTINAKIDDFRKLIIWDEDRLYKKKYRPKDVGHKRSVMQPFEKDNRDLNEVIASTELMLHITEMVKNTVSESEIELTRSL